MIDRLVVALYICTFGVAIVAAFGVARLLIR